MCQGEEIRVEDLTLDMGTLESGPGEEWMTLEDFERRYIQQTLERTGWVVKGAQGAAVLLGLNEGTLRSRMKKLGIRRS